ncbi:hemolysin family protein [Sphingomonas sp. 1P06PA]|uniref:hemolysin family protein n=1 Tax=Sphingomonas sp. 1P06PA TaxID=554121 RepID=UPI0039A65D7F
MPDDSSRSGGRASQGGRLWDGLRSLLFGEEDEPTLRQEIADAIEEHEGEPPSRGDLSPVERQMLRKLLDIGDLTVGDIGVPRADIIAVPETIGFDQLVATFAEHQHSRLPVYRGNLDSVVGMIHIRDVFRILATEAEPPADLAGLLREPLYVPESMGVLDLLAEMRSNRTHLAIVLDEYSGTEGLVTIEDLMEEIVGDIEDEHDEAAAALLVPLDDGLWEADARAELDDVAELIDPRLAEVDEDIDTIGGLATVLSGHVPQPGEIVTHASGWRLEVIAGDVKRVSRLRLHPPARSDGAEGTD